MRLWRKFRVTACSRSYLVQRDEINISNLEIYGSCTLDQDSCTTCGDVAVPVRVIERFGQDALVEDRLGQQAEVAIDFIKDVKRNDILFVHMGIAIGKGDLARG